MPLPNSHQAVSFETQGDETSIRFNVDRLNSDTTYWLAPPSEVELGRHVTLHLDNLQFIEPFGLVYLYWYLKFLGSVAVDVDVVLPENVNILNYLKRMHLPDCLQDMIQVRFKPTIDQWSLSERDLAGQLVELEKFEASNDDDVEDYAARMLEVILRRDQHINTSSELLRLALTEVISGGIGIPSSLRSAGFEGDDGELIREALKEGVTSRGIGRGGTGLSDLVHEVSRNGTRVEVRSGKGHVTVRPGNEFLRKPCRALPGTLIEVVW